jgi:hypothetical protein
MEKHEFDESELRAAAYSKSPTLEKFLGPMQHPDIWQVEMYKAAEEPIILADKHLGCQTMGIMADFLIEHGVQSNLFNLDIDDRRNRNYLRMLSAGIMVIGWDLVDEPDLLAFAEPEIIKWVKSSYGINKEKQGRKVAPVKAFVKDALQAGKIMRHTFDRVYTPDTPKVIEGVIVNEPTATLIYPDGPIGQGDIADVILEGFKGQISWPIYNDQNQIINPEQIDSDQPEKGGDYGLGI